MIQYTSEFGGELWLHPEWRSGQCLVFLTCVRCISLSWPFFFSRMTCLIWSHSQLNVPSGNISTFLRLKSIAIIFLRPWCAHPHARTHAHTQGHARGSASLCFSCHLIWLPFVWIFVLWAIGFKCALHFETGGWICRSLMRAAYPSRILAARSDSLIVSLPILLICGSFFFERCGFPSKSIHRHDTADAYGSRRARASFSILARSCCRSRLCDGRRSAPRRNNASMQLPRNTRVNTQEQNTQGCTHTLFFFFLRSLTHANMLGCGALWLIPDRWSRGYGEWCFVINVSKWDNYSALLLLRRSAS